MGRAGIVKEMGGKHSYTGRAEQGGSMRWVVTTAIPGMQSREYKGDQW